MAVDNITGIRLGVRTFKEGQNYSVGSVLGGLLSGLGLPVGVSGATAQFDITRDRITLYVSGLASVLGSNYSVDAKILLDGKARARRAGVNVTARDFNLSGVGAGAHIAGLEPTELVANASVKNLKISNAMKQLGRGRASWLLRKLVPGSLDVYVAPSTIGGLLSGALAGAGISTTGDRAIGVGGYGADLPLGWQSTLPLPLPV